MSKKLITEEDILSKIQVEYESGEFVQTLAQSYGVSRQVITRILKKREVQLRGRAYPPKLSSQESLQEMKNQGGRTCNKCGEFKGFEGFDLIRSKCTGIRDRPRSICKSCQSDRRIKRTYNLEPQEVKDLLVSQNFQCPICKKELNDHNRNIDHNHVTGEVRGLLCTKCNHRVGTFETFYSEITEYLIQTQERPNREEWLMEIARKVSQRSTCSRRKVGAILVYEGRILSHGYNGAPSGVPHCKHPIGESPDKSCETSVHAEANCIAWGARWGVRVKGSSLYTTLSPCLSCAQIIANSGVEKVYIDEMYRNTSGLDLLEESGIELIFMGDWRTIP